MELTVIFKLIAFTTWIEISLPGELNLSLFIFKTSRLNLDNLGLYDWMLYPELFDSLLPITHMRLKNNNLTKIPDFGTRTLSSIEKLGLKGNKIQFTKRDDFHNMTKLHYLTLWENNLESFPDFGEAAPSLVYIDLRENQICTLNSQYLENLASLADLDLSQNQFTSIADFTTLPCPSCVAVSLMYNLITSVELITVLSYKFKNLPLINIGKNPIICDCKMQWMEISLATGLMNWTDNLLNLKCAQPSNIKNVQVSELAFTSFECDGKFSYD